MSLVYRVFAGGPDNKPEQKPADQVWKKFDTLQIVSGIASDKTNFPIIKDDSNEALKLFKLIRGRRALSIFAGIGNDGVDINLFHGLEYLKLYHRKFPILIEVGNESDASTLISFTMWDVMMRNSIYNDEGYMFNFDVKGHFELEVYS